MSGQPSASSLPSSDLSTSITNSGGDANALGSEKLTFPTKSTSRNSATSSMSSSSGRSSGTSDESSKLKPMSSPPCPNSISTVWMLADSTTVTLGGTNRSVMSSNI